MWNTKCSNRIMERRIQYKAHMKHLQALHAIKGQMNITSPLKPTFLNSKPKSKQIAAEKKNYIQHNNDILIEKMFKIQSNIPQRRSLTESFKTSSLNRSYKKKMERQIDIGNQIIIKKLQQTQSCYPVDQILRQTNHYLYYKSNILNSNKNNTYNDEKNKSTSKIFNSFRPEFTINKRPFSAPKK